MGVVMVVRRLHFRKGRRNHRRDYGTPRSGISAARTTPIVKKKKIYISVELKIELYTRKICCMINKYILFKSIKFLSECISYIIFYTYLNFGSEKFSLLIKIMSMCILPYSMLDNSIIIWNR